MQERILFSLGILHFILTSSSRLTFKKLAPRLSLICRREFQTKSRVSSGFTNVFSEQGYF